ncbi:MAG: hypothetical protein LQ352_003513 [Teloschistes flavicans]|nr:MAG: hypothetical protein LQ352_003513 [Teloschistes flavicans]
MTKRPSTSELWTKNEFEAGYLLYQIVKKPGERLAFLNQAFGCNRTASGLQGVIHRAQQPDNVHHAIWRQWEAVKASTTKQAMQMQAVVALRGLLNEPSLTLHAGTGVLQHGGPGNPSSTLPANAPPAALTGNNPSTMPGPYMGPNNAVPVANPGYLPGATSSLPHNFGFHPTHAPATSYAAPYAAPYAGSMAPQQAPAWPSYTSQHYQSIPASATSLEATRDNWNSSVAEQNVGSSAPSTSLQAPRNNWSGGAAEQNAWASTAAPPNFEYGTEVAADEDFMAQWMDIDRMNADNFFGERTGQGGSGQQG